MKITTKTYDEDTYFLTPTIAYIDGQFEGYDHTIALVWLKYGIHIQW